LRWKWKVFLGVLIVSTLAMCANGAPAVVRCVPGALTAKNERLQPRKYVIISRSSADFSGEARRIAFGEMKPSASGEGALYFCGGRNFRRFLREKSMEFVTMDQGLSVVMSLPFAVFSKLEVASPFIRLFSTLLAIRK
jgi:hypothetical protein